MPQIPKRVFVVGCPRSGTSPFARWLHLCGLASVTDERRNERYPSGYFEHRPILMFLKSLDRLPRGSDHALTLEPLLRSELLEDPFIRQVFELSFAPVLKGEFEFLKVPQLALSIDFLFEHFRDVHVVALWRDPATTFRSLVTREFPREMIPGSGVKAILLWNMYAHHIVAARRAYPDDVTVLNIDAFLDDPQAAPALMERIGRPRDAALPVDQAIDRTLWNRGLSWPWRLYHHGMRTTCRLLRSRLGPEREALADQLPWVRALEQVSGLAGAPQGGGAGEAR